MNNLLKKLGTIIWFNCTQLFNVYLYTSVLLGSLFFVSFFFLYFITIAGISQQDNLTNFLIMTKMFIFMLQFVTCLFTITLGIYLFNDPTTVFLVSSTKSKMIPSISKFTSLQFTVLVITTCFIIVYTVFSALFYHIIPGIEIILILVCLNVTYSLLFGSMTFLSYSILNYWDIKTVAHAIFPVALFFIIPHFFYTGIAFGVFPDFLYAFTYQYHMSTLSNYLLTTPYNITLSLESAIASLSFIFSSILIAFFVSIVISAKTEYR